VVLLYKTDRFEGTLAASPEGEVFWTELKSLHTLPLAKSMDKMLRVFLEEDMSELYYGEPNKGWTLK
jgi:8-oxo-dGTP diphosphatase